MEGTGRITTRLRGLGVTLFLLGAAVPFLTLTGSAPAATVHKGTKGAPGRHHTQSTGRRNPAARASVIGGQPAEPGTFPWMAFVHDSRGEVSGICSGTVVSANLVLTAGHCAEDPETGIVNSASGYTVVTGSVDRTAAARQVSAVSRVLVYPGYTTSGTLRGWGDAALLELSTPSEAPAIRLASSEIWAPGTEAVIAGWGDTYYGEEASTYQLQWATTVVQSKEWCSANAPNFHPLGQVCAIDAPTYESGTCEGDSGGPMLASAPGTEELEEIGITSYGFGECSTTRPEVDTRSDLISAWVNARIKELEPTPVSIPPPPSGQSPSPSPSGQSPSPSQAPAPQVPAMSSGAARSYARQALIVAFDPAFAHRRRYRVNCRPVDTTEWKCGVSWLDPVKSYFGSVAVYYSLEDGGVVWNDRYAVHVVSVTCLRRGSRPKRCPQRIRHGAALALGGA